MFEEIKKILKKPLAIATIIGIIMIPTLYNLIFLSSMWDPYGRLSELPVAVVNKDKGKTVDDSTVNIGKDIINTLSKNRQLDYHFVSDKTASEGLKDGDYYMVITLPEALSESATSILKNEPNALKINYQTSQGHNYIASKMSETAMKSFKNQVTKDITYTYVKTIFDNLSKLKEGLGEANQGTSRLLNGTNQLSEGSQQLTNNLDTLSKSSIIFSDGTETFNQGLAKYTKGIQQLATGSQQLKTGISTYTDSVKQLAQGSNQLALQSDQLIGGLAAFDSQSQKINDLIAGLNQLNDSFIILANKTTVTDEQKNQLEALREGLLSLNNTLQSYSASLSSENTSETIEMALTTISTAATTLLTSNNQSNTDNITRLQQTTTFQNLTTQEQDELIAAITPNQSRNQNQEITDILTATQTIKNEFVNTKQSIERFKEATKELSQTSNQLLPLASEQIADFSNGMTTINQTLTNQILPGIGKIETGVENFKNQLSDGTKKLVVGANQYTSAVAQISQGTNQLQKNNDQLNQGASQLTNGLKTLNLKTAKLTSGADQLNQGANQLSQGANQLTSGSMTLYNGLQNVSSGVKELDDGIGNAQTKLNHLAINDDNATILSNPVNVKQKEKNKVSANGIGMAPYMISVALMVAAISTNVIFSGSISGRKIQTLKEWLTNKLAINLLIAMISAIVLFIALHFIGFEAKNSFETLGAMILSSLVFMTIVTTLVSWHARIGAFLSLILLILQLASSAGTYPIQLSDSIFQKINPLLPMTYSVKALRETISLNGHGLEQTLILVGFLLGTIVIGCFIQTNRFRNGRTSH